MRIRLGIVVLTVLLGGFAWWRLNAEREDRARAEELELELRRIEVERIRKTQAVEDGEQRMRSIYEQDPTR